MRRRGTLQNPTNRFERLRYVPPDRGDPGAAGAGAEVDPDLEPDPDEAEIDPRTEYLRDPSRTIVATNSSPDVGFDSSVNPYRGCAHGCSYCYARPHHEFLGWSAGLDFETRILVKERAPELLRRKLAHSRWKPQVVAFSGVTDPDQPAERRFRITRGCLEVLASFRNPVGLITKSSLVARDLDLLGELARWNAASVVLSVTTLDEELARRMEPQAANPRKRLWAIERLAEAGVPVGVNVAPIIPGLTDHEMPSILEAAANAGAGFAGMVMLRLPHGVKEIFSGWLEEHAPDRKAKVLNRLKEMRGGKLYDARFGVRGRGEGVYATQLRSVFGVACRRHGLAPKGPELSSEHFRVPGATTQLSLFT